MRAVLPIVPLLTLSALACAACGGAPTRTRYADALPPGCSVSTLTDVSREHPVRALGEVRARCTGDAMGNVVVCTRALHDQACALGADVVWGVTTENLEDATVMRAHAGRSQ